MRYARIAIKKNDLEWLVTSEPILESEEDWNIAFGKDVLTLTPSGARELAEILVRNADIAEGKG